MKNIIITIVVSVLFKANIYSQNYIGGKLINSQNNEPIEFANIWLIGENKGTTSNKNGEFSLILDSVKSIPLRISAIGFYDTTILSTDLLNKEDIIVLNERNYDISEVTVKPDGKIKKYTLNKIKQKDIDVRIASDNNPKMIAHLFKNNKDLSNSMLKELTIHTYRSQQDYICNIRLYENNNNMPGNEILNKNIKCISKKGSKDINIDLAKYELEFPDSGLFVCFEWLIIDQNIKTVEYSEPGSNKKKKSSFYGPILAGIIENNSHNWIYSNGVWEKNKDQLIEDYWDKKIKGKYCNIAVSLVILK